MKSKLIILSAFLMVFLAAAWLLKHTEEPVSSEQLANLVSVVDNNFTRLASEANNKQPASDKKQNNTSTGKTTNPADTISETIVAIIYKKSDTTWFIKARNNNEIINRNLPEFTRLFLEQLKFDSSEQPDFSHIPESYRKISDKPMRVATFDVNGLEISVAKLPGNQDVQQNIQRWRRQLSLTKEAPEFVKYQDNNKTILVKLSQNTASSQTTSANRSAQAPEKEKLEEFLQFELTSNWKKVNNESKMAAGKFQLNDNGKQYDVAVLRLPSSAPVEMILNIWKQKAGISAEQKLEVSNLTSKYQQQWKLYPLNGEQLNIVVAMHVGKTKYTFLRLASNKALPDSATSAFKIFLKNSKVIKP